MSFGAEFQNQGKDYQPCGTHIVVMLCLLVLNFKIRARTNNRVALIPSSCCGVRTSCLALESPFQELSEKV